METTDIIELYQQMAMIRSFEEKVAELYTQGLIFGFCHLCSGQEAVVTGINFLLHEVDSQITSYRDHGHMLICGVDPKEIMAELCGKKSGCSGGKGGSMHMYSKENRFFGGNGIVGAQVSIGTGLAFSHKYKNDGGIAVVYFGDGAANQGQVYESFNMASLWKLPALYVLENNHYAIGTPQSRSTSCDISSRGEVFGIPCFSTDGMDVIDVIRVTETAISSIRNGDGPAILHADTYRYRGHSMSDPGKYRTKEEVEHVKNTRDPIMRIRKMLIDESFIDKNALEQIDSKIERIVNEAANFAIKSDFPDESDLWKHVVS